MDPQQTYATIKMMVDQLLSSHHGIDAESLSIDIWTACWQAGRKPTWVEVHRRVIDTVRKTSSRREREENKPYSTHAPSAERSVDIQDYIDRVFKSIPEKERRFLRMRYFRGMSQSEIADQEGISTQRVGQIINRALCNIRRDILEHGYSWY
jgi:RNA polymerase sigma factor (sigma-70 family)